MIVEVYKKNTNLQKHFITLWNVKEIKHDVKYIIIFEDSKSMTFNSKICELRINY